MTKLYLAYGSNLNKRGMRYRCPDARPRGWKLLNNARLVFRGVADLDYEPDGLVPAGMWEISQRDEAALDRYEGVSSGLYNKFMIPMGDDEALIYLMADRNGIYPPSASYVQVIREGYRDFKLDMSFLDEAIKHSFEDKNPSEQTLARRDRQINSTNQRRLVQMPESVAIERVRAARERAKLVREEYWQQTGAIE